MRKLYLDIETTGLSRSFSDITVVGAYDGKHVTQLVNGINLTSERLENLFKDRDLLVSFNGARFDVPFIESKFPNIVPNIEHKDLMFLGWSLGWKGGLKAIEKMLGISRESDVKNGYHAVRLWKQYQHGNDLALERLLHYNREDIINLETIEKEMEKAKNERPL